MANISIYIANLGKYNEGYLVGKWIDLPATEEELNDLFVVIKVGHYNEDGEYVAGYEEDYSFYEEVAIHDYETSLSGLNIGEYTNIRELNELAEELEHKDLELIKAIVEATGCNLEEAMVQEDKAIFYQGYDFDDLAHEFIEQYDLPEFALRYFDYDAYIRDYIEPNHYEVDGGVICI